MALPLRERNTTRLSAVLHYIPPWLGRPPSVRASFFFAHRTRCLPDVCLQSALRVGVDSLGEACLPPKLHKLNLTQVSEWDDGQLRRKDDYLAAEEPLEIRVGDEPLSVTMRTPGHDLELAAGL